MSYLWPQSTSNKPCPAGAEFDPAQPVHSYHHLKALSIILFEPSDAFNIFDFVLFCFLSGNEKGDWRGPFTKKVWGDADCKSVEDRTGLASLRQCQWACSDSKECNVVNYNYGNPKKKRQSQCILWNCEVNGHIPEPTFVPPAQSFTGYCMSKPIQESGILHTSNAHVEFSTNGLTPHATFLKENGISNLPNIKKPRSP